eukprot:2530867-Pleurochrysis_carterae.AAC.2
MANLSKLHLSLLGDLAPAPVVVSSLHKKATQWGRRPCAYQKVQAQPVHPLSPPQSAPGACSYRGSKTRRSVPEGPGPFAPPSIRTRGFEGGRGRRHRPFPYQKVQLLPMSSRSC